MKNNPIEGGGTSEWEYLGEFTQESQPTFESGKYRFFYVETFFTMSSVGSTSYPFLCVDGYTYFRWAFANSANKKIYGLLIHGKVIIGFATNGNSYPTFLDRGNSMTHMAGTEKLSIGTAFFASSDATKPVTSFGIKLWGAK